MAFLALLALIWSGDFTSSIDFWGHLAKAEFLAEQIGEHGLSALFSSAWLPSWYLGDAFRTYYPPLTTLVLTPLVLLFKSPDLIHKVFASLALGAYAVGVYIYIRSLWGRWPASFGTLVALWAPYQMRTLFFEGNYPRMLALIALPVIAYFTEQLMKKNQRRMPAFMALSAAWAWAILAHPQQALIFAVGMAIYVVARLFVEPDVPFAWALWVLAALVGGALVSAPWSLPAYSYGEQPQVPFLPVEKIELFSAPLRSLLPVWDSMQGEITVGLGVFIILVLCVLSRPDRRRSAWALAAVVSIWLAFGPAGVFFSLLPMHNALMPERFLNFAAFAMAVGAAGIVPMRKRAVVIRVVILAVLIGLDIYPSLRMIRGRAFPQREAALGVIATEDTFAGRTLLLTYPEPSASEIYFAGEHNDLVNGWALENTPHHKAVRRYLGAVDWGPDYLAHLMGIWDVNQVAIRADGNEIELTGALVGAGFQPSLTIGEYAVWERREPQSPVQILPADRMLVLGDGIAHLLAAFPFAEEALEESLADRSAEDLAAFLALAVSHFASDDDSMDEIEALAAAYASAGGALMVDLSGMEETFASALDFLDVRVLRIEIIDSLHLRWDESLGDLPTMLPLNAAGSSSWSGAVYSQLDRVFAEVELDGEWFPVLGYRDIGAGRVWFVGMNLLYYAQEADTTEIFTLVRELLLAEVDVSQDREYEPVSVSGWEADGRGVSFDYESPTDIGEALISYTYSPRWELQIDGVSTTFFRYENLIRTSLPAGTHRVELIYHPYGTIYPIAGLVIGMLAVTGIGIGYGVERKRWRPLLEDQREGREEEPKDYAVCANCSFRFAEVGPPTASTYPFQVVYCPICGLQMDEEGFEPGADLSEEERARALDDWLSENRYNPEVVHERWGFSSDEFFSSTMGEEEEETFESPPDQPFL